MPSFKALVEHSSDVISLLNVNGEVLYASPSSRRVFGYLPEEMIGQNAFEFVHPKDRFYSETALREVMDKPPGPRQVETRMRHKSGEWCWVESTISNLLDEPPVSAIVVNYREIGIRKAQAEQSSRQTQDLTRANAVLEDFAYAVAHDLKEPLRSISMFTDIMLRDARLDDHGQQHARFIQDGVERISALLDGLDTFAARGFTSVSERLDLSLVVAEALQDLGYAITSNAVNVTLGELPWVVGNEKHLVRIFENLITNAIKYRSEAPVQIHISAEQLGPQWLIRLRDNGIGVAPEHQERIFGLLKRLHGPEISGVGIGLAVCRKQIEASGGTIWVESELGAGSTFCFTVPGVPEKHEEFLQAEENGEKDRVPNAHPRWRGIRRVHAGS
jgi:PAS domain S-box-containing protein